MLFESPSTAPVQRLKALDGQGGFPSTPEAAESGRVPFRSSALSVRLSGGHVEQLGGFIWVIDRQADGSDVL